MNKLNEFKEYLEHSRCFSQATVRAYEKDVEDYLMAGLLPEKYIQSSPLKPSSKYRKLSALRHYFGWLERQGFCTGNLFKTISNPKIKDSLPKYVEKEDVEAMIANAKTMRNKLIFRILFETGIRITELCNLNVSDINLSNGTIRITVKGNLERLAFISSSSLFKELEGFIAGRDLKEPFLKGRRGRLTQRAVQKIIRRASSGKFTPHSFRHGFARLPASVSA